jgi:hypothetical protein
VGNQTEGIVLAALMQAGKVVLLPFGGGHRYDIAIDEAGSLVRVQCKTAHLRKGCVVFSARSTLRNGASHSYRGDADLFGVYSAHTGCVYLVPVDEVGDTQVWLRLGPTKNNQKTGIRWAEKYLLKPPLASPRSSVARAADS